jgi:enolase
LNNESPQPARSESEDQDHSSSEGARVVVSAAVASQILDSRGNPTVQVKLQLADGTEVEASAPSGASTGEHEAVELRDGGRSFSGRSVRKAVAFVNTEIGELLRGNAWTDIRQVDDALRSLDGTDNYHRLGANSVVATSIAMSRAFAQTSGQSLHGWIASVTGSTELLPVPHFNVLNGGAHASNDLEFQEFMIAPIGAANEEHAVQTGAEIYHALAARIRTAYGSTGLGDEGGFAPAISKPQQALDLLVQAIGDAGYVAGVSDVAIAMDPAANGFYQGDGKYLIDGTVLTREALADLYVALVQEYPIRSIEDGFAEDDHDGWKLLFERMGGRLQLVGDDLYVTDADRIRDGARNGYSNAALIKPNQIGTVSQTFDAIDAARASGMRCMVSHRSGETGDTFIADLAVGTGVGQIKSGAPARGERVAKYNRLMAIETDAPTLGYGLD